MSDQSNVKLETSDEFNKQANLKGRLLTSNSEEEKITFKNIVETNDNKQISIENGNNKKINMDKCNFDGCNRKLSLLEKTMKCKCENVFCSRHKHAEKHECTFDYKNNGTKQLEKILVKIEPKRIEKI